MSKLHEVASFNSILIKNSQVLLIPDDVSILLLSLSLPKIWGDEWNVSGGGAIKRL